MSWKPSKRGGWGKIKDGYDRRFTQILRFILEVVPGGVIRAGKKAYSDDDHVGFWIGIDGDGLAKMNLGGKSHYLKWTGTEINYSGKMRHETAAGLFLVDPDSTRFVEVTTTSGAPSFTAIRAEDEDGTGVHGEGGLYGLSAYSETGDGVYSQSLSGVAVKGASTYGKGAEFSSQEGGEAVKGRSMGNIGVYGLADVTLLGDPAGGPGVKGEAVGDSYGVLGKGSKTQIYVPGQGMVDVMAIAGIGAEGSTADGIYAIRVIDGQVHGGNERYRYMGDATADTDALNRQTGDGRYLQQSDGWTGSYTNGDGDTVTVVNGQITDVS